MPHHHVHSCTCNIPCTPSRPLLLSLSVLVPLLFEFTSELTRSVAIARCSRVARAMDPGFVFEDAFGEEEGAVQDAWEAQEALLDAVSIRPARGRSLDAKIRDQQDQARRRTRGMAMEGGLERGREGRKRAGRRNGKSAGSDGSDSDRPGVDSEEDEGEEVEEEAWEDRLEAATKRKDATKSDRNRDERQEKGLEEADDPSASSSDDERVEEDEQGGGGGDELPSAEGEEQGRTKTKSIRDFFDTKAKASFSAKSFHDLHLSRPLLKACVALGYETPTPIQVRGVRETKSDRPDRTEREQRMRRGFPFVTN